MTSIKGIIIEPDKTVREVTIDGLDDMQAAVKGWIEPVDLNGGVTMLVNEEGPYQFTPEDANYMASDVAALGGRPEFMFGGPPLLGPVLLLGDGGAEFADLPDQGRALGAACRPRGWRDMDHGREVRDDEVEGPALATAGRCGRVAGCRRGSRGVHALRTGSDGPVRW
jgi:hypothetical protein